MNWSKAKTILIIAFIITNILLIHVIIGQKRVLEPTLKDNFIDDVIDLLRGKNISISTQIPKDEPSLNTLGVEYEIVDIERLNRNYFNYNGFVEQNEDGLAKIIKGHESILLLNNRFIVYENKDDKQKYADMDMDKAIELSKNFIRKGKFETSDLELTFTKEEKGVFYIEYSKTYGEIFIEKAFTNIQVDKRGIRRFERLWLNDGELGDIEIKISTAPKSILTLLGMQEVYGKNIVDISLCYYFDPEKHEYLGEPKEAKRGNTTPAWRVQFEDGYKIFIDEY